MNSRTNHVAGRTRLLVGGATVALLTFGLVASPARADPVGDKQARARALAQQIDSLGAQESALAEQYNKTALEVQAAQANLALTTARASQADADTGRARALLRVDSIDAYVHGGRLAGGAGATVDAQTAILRAAYVQTLASTQSDHLDGFRIAAAQAKAAAATLEGARRLAAGKAEQLNSARAATVASARQLQNTLDQVKGEIATQIAQIEAVQQADAVRQAQQLLARQPGAPEQPPPPPRVSGTSPVGPPTAAPAVAPARPATMAAGSTAAPPARPVTSRPAPPVGSGATAAVAAAMSRLGLPYVWGAAGPDSFDCSGLTLWAWAHGGVSLPHFSGAQYASTTHISMADLQPGDLVFFADPGAHVAMYIGGGQVIAAPHSGTVVQIQALSSGYVLAGRP